MEMINWKTLINIITIIVLCEFLYWTTSDLLLFNTKTLNFGLEFLYYTMAAFVALILTISLTAFFEKIPILLSYLLLVLINTYVVVCIFHLYTTACDDQKNLNIFYSSIDVLLLTIVGYLLIFKILPKLKMVDKLTVVIATVLLLIDFIFLLIGYKLFYPGNW